MTFADDAGEYSVFAKNQLGEVSASASLLEEGTQSLESVRAETEEQRQTESFSCFSSSPGEYEAYMKTQEATFKTEVTAVVQEPQVGDVAPVVLTTTKQMTSTIISGQVGGTDTERL